jgi:hypothetical protein
MSRAKPQRTQLLSRLKPMNRDRQAKKPAPLPSGNPVVNLLQKHALLLFVAVWAGLLGVAVSAGKVLIYSDVEIESASTAAKSQIEAANIQNAGKLPVLLFGAIALTCVAGSWMILQQLHDPKPRRPVRRPRPKPRPNASDSSTDQQRQLPQLLRRDTPVWGNQQPPMPRRPSPIQPLVPDEPDEKDW